MQAAVVVFFFFQAEDGIRDDLVTGVQTCALPISSPRRCAPRASRRTTGRESWKPSARNAGVMKRCRSRRVSMASHRNAPRPASLHHRSEEHTSELQSPDHLVCRLLLEKKKINQQITSQLRLHATLPVLHTS